MLSALLALAGRALADPPDLPDPPASSAADLSDEEQLDDWIVEDVEATRSAIDVGAALAEDSLAAASGLVDVTSMHDLAARHHRPSPWGRIDLAIAWRRVERIERDASEPSRRDEVWLVATWRN